MREWTQIYTDDTDLFFDPDSSANAEFNWAPIAGSTLRPVESSEGVRKRNSIGQAFDRRGRPRDCQRVMGNNDRYPELI